MIFSKTILIPLLSCGMLLSGCNGSTPTEDGWATITYQEILQAYNNKQDSPYNHREYTYYDVGNQYRLVEDLDGSTWVVDANLSDTDPGYSPLQWFESQYTIATYEPYIDQVQSTIEKNEAEHKYRYRIEANTSGHLSVQDVIVEQYFNYLKFLQYMDGELSGGGQDIVYSIK